MELKKQKIDDASGNYSWTDYMSLPFTQNVSLKSNVWNRTEKWIIFLGIHVIFFLFLYWVYKFILYVYKFTKLVRGKKKKKKVQWHFLVFIS